MNDDEREALLAQSGTSPTRGNAMTEDELLQSIREAWTLVPPRSDWRHYKGTLYCTTHLEHRESDCAVMVGYRRITSDGYESVIIWTRPLSEWLETVDVDGQQVPRYRREAVNT